MAQRHNLKTVVAFEFFRTVKKKSFWIATLAVPIILGVVFSLIYFSGKSSDEKADAQKDAKFSIEYKDTSGLINPQAASTIGAKQVADKTTGINDVKTGKVDAFFYYPADPTTQKIESYAKDVGLFDNGKYESVAGELLSVSLEAKVGNEKYVSLIKKTPDVASTNYKDGEATPGIMGVIGPMLFLAIFYIVIVLLGSNMLNSTVEEKENRVTEMILTTLNPKTLIIGKIISTFLAGFLQIIILATPTVIAFLLFRNQLHLPNFDVSQLVFEPVPMVIGALLLIGGFMVFTGALVAIGAIMPTAKEAGQFFGAIMAAMFIPFYITPMLLSDPHSFIVTIFTYFPLSAPVTALMRNALGTLSTAEASIVIIELFVVGVVIIRLAVQLFRYGSLEYNKRLNIKTIFKRS
jgi:ABC-2 type transport system permease protein